MSQETVSAATFYFFCTLLTMPFWAPLVTELLKTLKKKEVEVVVVEKPVTIYKEPQENPSKKKKKKNKSSSKTKELFISEVSTSLVNMGFAKKDAKNLVLATAKGKKYKSAEDLLTDCVTAL